MCGFHLYNRRRLREQEDSLEDFETKLDKAIRNGNLTIESGKTFVKNQTAFLESLYDITCSVEAEEGSEWRCLTDACLTNLSNFTRFFSAHLDSIHRNLDKTLKHMLRGDIFRVKETKRHFDKISDDLDCILIKTSQLPSSKSTTPEGEELDNLLTATRSCFLHTSLDYVNQLSVFQCRKRMEILEFLSNSSKLSGDLFSTAKDDFASIEHKVTECNEMLSELKECKDSMEKQLEKSHSQVKNFRSLPMIESTASSTSDVRLQGYLFKRTTNAFKTWNRRWFMIKDNKLMYKKRLPYGSNNVTNSLSTSESTSKITETHITVMEEDLRLCSVKPFESERRFCFEVVSPARSHILQAEGEESWKRWMQALADGIDAAYCDSKSSRNILRKNNSADSLLSSTPRGSKSSKSSLASLASSGEVTSRESDARVSLRPSTEVLLQGDNFECCECKCPDPKWSSINLCITLCIECSGIHRSFGVHVSKVRSLTLDDWEPVWIRLLSALGNAVNRQIFEALLPVDDPNRITATSSREEREKWIRAKYIERKFVAQTQPCEKDVLETRDEINAKLFYAVCQGDLLTVSSCIARGGDVNWRNDTCDGKTGLHESVTRGNSDISEYLLLNGAKINSQDFLGRVPLYLAIQLGIRRFVLFLSLVCSFLSLH